MIKTPLVFEERLGEILNLMPPIYDIKGNAFQHKYQWGTQDVLNKFMALKKNYSQYPLIWLVIGQDNHSMLNDTVNRKATLILATHSDKQNEFNPFIYQTDYKNILNPLLNNVLTVLEQSGRSTITDDNYQIERLPNYSVNGKGKTVDVWNAIALTIGIELRDGCLHNNIKFS